MAVIQINNEDFNTFVQDRGNVELISAGYEINQIHNNFCYKDLDRVKPTDISAAFNDLFNALVSSTITHSSKQDYQVKYIKYVTFIVLLTIMKLRYTNKTNDLVFSLEFKNYNCFYKSDFINPFAQFDFCMKVSRFNSNGDLEPYVKLGISIPQFLFKTTRSLYNRWSSITNTSGVDFNDRDEEEPISDTLVNLLLPFGKFLFNNKFHMFKKSDEMVFNFSDPDETNTQCTLNMLKVVRNNFNPFKAKLLVIKLNVVGD